jgi:hypothetical protein
MTKKLEIYLRHSSRRTLLMFHVPDSEQKNFVESLQRGDFSSTTVEINLELSVRPEWISDPEAREAVKRSGTDIHIRVPLSAITATYSPDDE